MGFDLFFLENLLKSRGLKSPKENRQFRRQFHSRGQGPFLGCGTLDGWTCSNPVADMGCLTGGNIQTYGNHMGIQPPLNGTLTLTYFDSYACVSKFCSWFGLWVYCCIITRDTLEYCICDWTIRIPVHVLIPALQDRRTASVFGPQKDDFARWTAAIKITSAKLTHGQ